MRKWRGTQILNFHVQMVLIRIDEMVRVRAPMKREKDLYCYIDKGWDCE